LRAAANFIVELDRRLHGRFNEQDAFFDPSWSTFEPTRKDANVPNINTIPGEDVFYLDCRVLPQVRLADVLEEMAAIRAGISDQFEVETSLEECMNFEAPQPTASDSPVVVELAQAVQEVYGVQARPVGIGGQTVATFFRKKGLPAAVWEKILGLAHAPNERISVENLVGNAKVFARMMV
jgi:succinyl-diaminopimelate desuccinylase